MTTISVENRLAIHELIAEYSHCVDNYRGEDWADLFLEDGKLVGTDNPFFGRQALIDQADTLKNGPTEYRHLITNVFIEPGATDQHAVAQAYGTVADWAEKPAVMSIFVEYRFELVKREERWQIAELKVYMPYGIGA